MVLTINKFVFACTELLAEGEQLKINWVLSRVGLSGGVKSNRLIAEAMVSRGHQVSIYYVDLPPPRPPIRRIRRLLHYYLKRLQSLGKQQHHLESSTAHLEPVYHYPILSSDVQDADITIATWWETAYWIKDWPDSKGKKTYFIRHHELHGGDHELVRQTYHLPYKKFVIASWLKKLMTEQYGDNDVTIVPNGVDWQQFNYISRRKNTIPTIGMLFGKTEWKGASTAFRAIKLVQKTIPGIRIVCFGAHQITRNFEKPDNFEYYFRPSQKFIPEIYRSADCWLMPSTTEGFGMPGLEAAACGCPIVSTRCGGPEDYVKEGYNGYLAAVGDARDIADKLLKVIQLSGKEWKTMSQNSAELAKSFDWHQSAGVLENELYSLLDANKQKT